MRLDKAAFLILASVWATCFSAAATAVEEGDTAPRWHAADFDGRAVDFPAIAGGKPAVVVFWATWCGYCKAFMPYLKDIEADYAEAGIKIVAINAKEDGRGDPQGFVRGLSFPAIAIRDGDAIAQA